MRINVSVRNDQYREEPVILYDMRHESTGSTTVTDVTRALPEVPTWTHTSNTKSPITCR